MLNPLRGVEWYYAGISLYLGGEAIMPTTSKTGDGTDVSTTYHYRDGSSKEYVSGDDGHLKSVVTHTPSGESYVHDVSPGPFGSHIGPNHKP